MLTSMPRTAAAAVQDPAPALRSRVKGLAVLPCSRIAPDQNNFRLHPERQREALRAVLRDLGSVAAVLVRPSSPGALKSLRRVARGDGEAFQKWLAGYKAGFTLVDGHLRVEEAGPEGEVECLVLDLDGREAAEALATFDAVGDLAGFDQAAFLRNAELFNSTEPEVQRLVADLARMRVAEEREAAGVAEAEREQAAEDGSRIDVDPPSGPVEANVPNLDGAERARITAMDADGPSFPDTPSPDPSAVIAGEARWAVVQGDALAVLKSFPDASFDALVTDPPYSSGGAFRGDRTRPTTEKYVQTGRALSRPEFAGDNRDQRSFVAWCALWLAECQRILKPGAPVCLFTDWRQLPATTDALQAGGFVWRGIVPWDKTEGVRPQKGRFAAQAEYIVWGSNGPLDDDRGVGCLAGCVRQVVLQSDKHHETGKPTELMRRINAICVPGGVILDPFFGSGSTGAAALLDGYRVVGIEKTDAYAPTACGRLAHVEREMAGRVPSGPAFLKGGDSPAS